MNGTYNITYDGKEAGKLKVYSEGLKTVFFAETVLIQGVVRLAVISSGKAIPIGVLLPSGKGLSIKKGLSKNSLFDLGIAGIDEVIVTGNETEKARESGWQPVSEPALHFYDADLKVSCKGARGALISKTGDITQLAFPVRKAAPFALMPAFCLGRPARIEENDYLVFNIKDGNIFA